MKPFELAVPVGAQCPGGTPAPCAPSRRPPPPPEVRARHLMLLPFRNVTRTPANDWLVSGAPLMLGQAFGQFTDLMVVPDARLTAAIRQSVLDLREQHARNAALLQRSLELTGQTLQFLQRLVLGQPPTYSPSGLAGMSHSLVLDGRA